MMVRYAFREERLIEISVGIKINATKFALNGYKTKMMIIKCYCGSTKVIIVNVARLH
jgi:hypothetical protein